MEYTTSLVFETQLEPAPDLFELLVSHFTESFGDRSCTLQLIVHSRELVYISIMLYPGTFYFFNECVFRWVI